MDALVSLFDVVTKLDLVKESKLGIKHDYAQFKRSESVTKKQSMYQRVVRVSTAVSVWTWGSLRDMSFRQCQRVSPNGDGYAWQSLILFCP